MDSDKSRVNQSEAILTDVDGADIIERGRRVVEIEGMAVRKMYDQVDHEFARAVNMILKCKGRVVITGMGKSGIVGKKIVATMNSTGTPAIYLHPSDAVHGDLGMVRSEDIVICISKSGNTEEIVNLLPLLKRIEVPIIAMTGNPHSKIAQHAMIILNIDVDQEACSLDLAPTASTTATLVLGDALAITLLEKRNFTREDFARFHPGGHIGKRLLLKVQEMMVKGDAVPIVQETVSLKDAIIEMTTKRLGATCIVDGNGILTGVITDGDLRRLLGRTLNVNSLTARDVMSKNPKTIGPGTLAATAMQQMEMFSITQLIITDDEQKPIGMVHLHDLVKAGLSQR
jgi:arabinose-5-phosphate isomerase